MTPLVTLLLLFSLLLSTSCNSSQSAFGDHQSSEDKSILEPVLHDYLELPEKQPTIIPMVADNETPSPEKTLEELFNTSPSPTTNPVFVVCSPLQLHTLENLPTIISGPYDPPPPGKDERHHGVDFGYWVFEDRTTMQGELVQSILPGVVVMVLDDLFPYGNTVMVETPASKLPDHLVDILGFKSGESLYTLYAHLDSSPKVSRGDYVGACQLLGEVGLSGNTDVAHLHLETRLGPSGAIFESMMFYSTSATIDEMENYKLWRTSGVFRHFDPMMLLLFESP